MLQCFLLSYRYSSCFLKSPQEAAVVPFRCTPRIVATASTWWTKSSPVMVRPGRTTVTNQAQANVPTRPTSRAVHLRPMSCTTLYKRPVFWRRADGFWSMFQAWTIRLFEICYDLLLWWQPEPIALSQGDAANERQVTATTLKNTCGKFRWLLSRFGERPGFFWSCKSGECSFCRINWKRQRACFAERRVNGLLARKENRRRSCGWGSRSQTKDVSQRSIFPLQGG